MFRGASGWARRRRKQIIARRQKGERPLFRLVIKEARLAAFIARQFGVDAIGRLA
jgi:hypothetical protein